MGGNSWYAAQVGARLRQDMFDSMSAGILGSSKKHLSYEQEKAIHRNNDLMELQNLNGVPLIDEFISHDTGGEECLNCSNCIHSFKVSKKKSLLDIFNEITCGYEDDDEDFVIICKEALKHLSIEESKVDEYHHCDLYKLER